MTTNEAKTVQIFTALGWRHQKGEPMRFGGGPQNMEGWFDPEEEFHEELPNIWESLDAIASARARLTEEQQRKHRDELAKILGVGWYRSNELLNAPAAAHAEALHRTLCPQ